jgi:hypothetical protein
VLRARRRALARPRSPDREEARERRVTRTRPYLSNSSVVRGASGSCSSSDWR